MKAELLSGAEIRLCITVAFVIKTTIHDGIQSLDLSHCSGMCYHWSMQ